MPAAPTKRSHPRRQTVPPHLPAPELVAAAPRSRNNPIRSRLLLLSLPPDPPPTTPPTPPPTTLPKTSPNPPSNSRTLSPSRFETINPTPTLRQEPTPLLPLGLSPPTNSPISIPPTLRDTSTKPNSTVRTEEARTVTFLRETSNRRDPLLSRGGHRRQPTLLLSSSHR